MVTNKTLNSLENMKEQIVAALLGREKSVAAHTTEPDNLAVFGRTAHRALAHRLTTIATRWNRRRGERVEVVVVPEEGLFID